MGVKTAIKTKHNVSRNFIDFTIAIALWAWMASFFLSAIIFNHYNGDATSKICMGILTISIGLVFLFMGYKLVYKPIKQLEVT